MMNELNPGITLVLGALLVPLLPGRALRGALLLALPAIAFYQIMGLSPGELGRIPLFDMTLTTLRVDGLSVIFAYIFVIAAFLGGLYALHVDGWLQHSAALAYAGSAIGAVFAGDLVTLFVFWELTAITSVFLVWASTSPTAMQSGLRYLIIQVGSGVILLAGILMLYRESGSIAFGAIGIDTLPGQVILFAIGIKCAFPLLHNWLTNAYPEATVSGTVFLSAFTTKLAVYTLARGYAGTEILIDIGLVMAVFTVLYAVIENDLRRSLAYALIGQLGLMVAAIGIGSELAINGAVAHAVCGILYFALLFMAVGAVHHRTGTSYASELGGLHRQMPWTTAFCLIGAASICALPLFAGFVSKSLILSAAMKGGHFWAWIILLAASAAVVIHSGAKVPYFAFFAKPGQAANKRTDVTEAPLNMLVAMGLTAGMCILTGIHYQPLYDLLPHKVKYDPYTLDHVITQFQLVAFALLAFVLLLRFGLYPRLARSTLLDSDWIYRVPGRHLAKIANRFRSLTWELLADSTVTGATKAHNALERLAGPDGPFGRTWPTGTMAFWTTVTLGAIVILSYL